jgi:cysteine desulfurase
MTQDLRPIYLDCNATAPLRPEVAQAMSALYGQPLNPSSIHSSGRLARKIVEEARGAILDSVGAKGQGLVFTSTATEANNLVLKQADRYIVSEIEHDSVYKVQGARCKVLGDGVVDLDYLEELVSKAQTPNPESRILVSVMLANNETGIIQPIAKVVEIAKRYGALVHADAVQAYGRININFAELGVDFMTISGHKAGGPVGAAALVHKKEIELKPLMFGGGQEKNKRPGTENVVAIHGLGFFASSYAQDVPRETKLSNLNKYLEDEITKQAPNAVVVGANSARLPNTSCIIMPGFEAATQLIHFDGAGICVSSGSACSSGKVEVSRSLKAMGVTHAKNAIRISTGWATTKNDVDAFIAKWIELYKKA